VDQRCRDAHALSVAQLRRGQPVDPHQLAEVLAPSGEPHRHLPQAFVVDRQPAGVRDVDPVVVVTTVQGEQVAHHEGAQLAREKAQGNPDPAVGDDPRVVQRPDGPRVGIAAGRALRDRDEILPLAPQDFELDLATIAHGHA
jgi:hypothetical protein